MKKVHPIETTNQFEPINQIAIIGMACRFPGAKTINEFWENLQNGVESVVELSDEEILNAGVSRELLERKDYVKAGAPLNDVDLFDADFFGITSREAKYLDPQQRLFMESAWEAIESAGYVPDKYSGAIGVYAGAGANTYLLNNIASNHDLSGRALLETIPGFQVMLGNDKDHLATRVSYRLNLRGPSFGIQTACSTSLVAVHVACQSLISGECDIALAGGASISVPERSGYLYQEDMILSPDGHCRAFDANAQGTIFGNGVGVVVLKRLEEALADNDDIYAVIKGSAINNDGNHKVSYSAPSVEGQTDVISEAMAVADVLPETISYVETHGTGTKLGDPIEIAALTEAFRESTDKRRFCAIGSVKSNFGHLVVASGVAGLIKAALSLKNKSIPPSLHFEKNNPMIDFSSSPFYVNTELSQWAENGKTPRRASVSSFGMGGTNAHVVLEEAPAISPQSNKLERPLNILTISARNEQALSESVERFKAYLTDDHESKLADICFTANSGRQHFEERFAVIGSSKQMMREKLDDFEKSDGSFDRRNKENSHKVAFLYTGQGSQYVEMGRNLYETQPDFRKTIDLCDEILREELDQSLLSILYDLPVSLSPINQTAYAQPALFSIEYALTQLWKSWGVKPDTVMGHSVGEYAAACVAGVFSLEDGLRLIASRGRLMQAIEEDGGMLAIFASQDEVDRVVAKFAPEDLVIAALNSPHNTIISGKKDAIRQVLVDLEESGIEAKELRVSHAFHSPLMEGMLDEFEKVAATITYSQPKINLVSNLTGKSCGREIADYRYWVNHVRQPVQFLRGMDTLYQEKHNTFIEIGPKQTLLTMGKACLAGLTDADRAWPTLWLPSMRLKEPGWNTLLDSLGVLYRSGFDIDWKAFDSPYSRRRLKLPNYPFQRQRYWIDMLHKSKGGRVLQGKGHDVSEEVEENWLYTLDWQACDRKEKDSTPLERGFWAVFADEGLVASQLVEQLENKQCNFVIGCTFRRRSIAASATAMTLP